MHANPVRRSTVELDLVARVPRLEIETVAPSIRIGDPKRSAC